MIERQLKQKNGKEGSGKDEKSKVRARSVDTETPVGAPRSR